MKPQMANRNTAKAVMPTQKNNHKPAPQVNSLRGIFHISMKGGMPLLVF